jgi:hypothetical protein
MSIVRCGALSARHSPKRISWWALWAHVQAASVVGRRPGEWFVSILLPPYLPPFGGAGLGCSQYALSGLKQLDQGNPNARRRVGSTFLRLDRASGICDNLPLRSIWFVRVRRAIYNSLRGTRRKLPVNQCARHQSTSLLRLSPAAGFYRPSASGTDLTLARKFAVRNALREFQPLRRSGRAANIVPGVPVPGS